MSRVKGAITPVLVGGAMGVADDALGAEHTEKLGLGALVAGIAVPAFVPGMEKIGDNVAAVGAYMAAKNFKLADKIGLGVNGVGDRHALGNTSKMFIERKVENRKASSNSATPSANPMG